MKLSECGFDLADGQWHDLRVPPQMILNGVAYPNAARRTWIGVTPFRPDFSFKRSDEEALSYQGATIMMRSYCL